MVVWDRVDYLKEAEKQLGDNTVYERVDINNKKMLSQFMDTSNKYFRSLKNRNYISEKELRYFTYEYKRTCNLGKLYLLPKIHKRLENVPGRPVISNCGAPTEKVSEFLDHHLKPVMRDGLSYIKDSGHFLEKTKGIGSIPENSLLVTADVVGLYPNIPHQVGLNALKEALDKRDSKKMPTEDLIKMAKFVLSNNIFEFNNKAYQQKSGTAIGTKFAPPYACIYMDQVEQKFLETQNDKPLVWLRYIDDIFFIWTRGKKKIQLFLKELNDFTPNLKFTHESNSKSIPFLDVNVKLVNGRLLTDLYIKSTDRHQYLHYSSSHPEHTKRSIVYSQTLRINRLCSLEDDFNYHKNNMKTWFKKRGYPESVIENEMKKVKFSNERRQSKRKDDKGVPFVVTFHPLLKKLGAIIHRNLYLLYMNEEVKKVFTPGPMVSFRSPRKISSYLVRAKLYPLKD